MELSFSLSTGILLSSKTEIAMQGLTAGTCLTAWFLWTHTKNFLLHFAQFFNLNLLPAFKNQATSHKHLEFCDLSKNSCSAMIS